MHSYVKISYPDAIGGLVLNDFRKSAEFATTKHHCYADLPFLFNSWSMRPGEKTARSSATNKTPVSP